MNVKRHERNHTGTGKGKRERKRTRTRTRGGLVMIVRHEQQELDPRNATIQGMEGIISIEALSEQEHKRLCQKLKKAERQIQLYSTVSRNRAERRAKGKR